MKRALLIQEQEILIYGQKNARITFEAGFMAGDEAQFGAFLQQDDAAYLILVWPGEAQHIHLPPGLKRSDRDLLLQKRIRDQNCESTFLSRTTLPHNEGTVYQFQLETSWLIACLEQLRASGKRIIGLSSPDLLCTQIVKTYATVPEECMISWQIGQSLLQIYLRAKVPRFSRRIRSHHPNNTLTTLRQFRSHLIRQQLCSSDRPLTCVSLGATNWTQAAEQHLEAEFQYIAPPDAASEEAVRDECLRILLSSKPHSYSLGKYARENQIYSLALTLRISAGLLVGAALLHILDAGGESYRLTQMAAAEDQRITQNAQSIRLLQEKLPAEYALEIEEAQDWRQRPPPIKPILENIALELLPLESVDLVQLQWEWARPQHLRIQMDLRTENKEQAAQLAKRLKGELKGQLSDWSLSFDLPTRP